MRLLVPLSHAGVVFEIGNALQKKNAARAFKLINQQLARKETAIGILRASIIPTVRNLFMSAAASDGRNIPNGNYNQFAGALNAIPEEQWPNPAITTFFPANKTCIPYIAATIPCPVPNSLSN